MLKMSQDILPSSVLGLPTFFNYFKPQVPSIIDGNHYSINHKLLDQRRTEYPKPPNCRV